MTKKSITVPTSEKRKPYKFVRVKWALFEVGEARAAELVQDFTQYVNDAIRMRLEAEGKWPPPPKGK